MGLIKYMGLEACSWCGSEDTHASTEIPFCYCTSVAIKIKRFQVLWFEKQKAGHMLCSKLIAGSRVQTFFGKTDRSACSDEPVSSVGNLPRLPKGYTGKWDKSSPVRRDQHEQPVLKDDGAEWFLSPAIMVQYKQQNKVCIQPKQSLKWCNLYNITERILSEVVKSQGFMSQSLARELLLTVWNQVLKALSITNILIPMSECYLAWCWGLTQLSAR